MSRAITLSLTLAGLLLVGLGVTGECPLGSGGGSGGGSSGGASSGGGSSGGGSSGGGSSGGGVLYPKPPTPYSPSPRDGTTDIDIHSLTLSWRPQVDGDYGGIEYYSIFFGTNRAPASNDNYIGDALTSSKRIDAGYYDLEYATTYYWRVLANNHGGQSMSPQWSFTTEGNPDPNLTEGVHQVTLDAAAAKRYRLALDAGDQAFVNLSMDDSQTDIDLFAYAPNSQSPVAQSVRGRGLPDHVSFRAASSGDYSVEVVNLSNTGSATAEMVVQRIESSTAALHGVYKIVQVDSAPVANGEEWIFEAAVFASFRGTLLAQDFGLSEDLVYWIGARTRAVTDVYADGHHLSIRIDDSQTNVVGSSVELTIDYSVTANDTSNRVEQRSSFSGTLTSGGDTLAGTLHTRAWLNDDLVFDGTNAVTLHRQ